MAASRLIFQIIINYLYDFFVKMVKTQKVIETISIYSYNYCIHTVQLFMRSIYVVFQTSVSKLYNMPFKALNTNGSNKIWILSYRSPKVILMCVYVYCAIHTLDFGLIGYK